MATRFYFSPTEVPVATLPAPTSWTHTGNEQTFQMRTTKYGDAMTLFSSAYDGADHLVDADALLLRMVSPPLAVQTPTSSQLFKLQVRADEGTAGNNLFLTVKIIQVNPAGSVVQTWLAMTRTSASEIAAQGSGQVNRRFNGNIGTLLSGVGRGDRLVVEIGAGGLPTGSAGVQGHNFKFSIGSNSATDLAEDDTTTAADNPWCEFADTLTFAQPAPPPTRRRAIRHFLGR